MLNLRVLNFVWNCIRLDGRMDVEFIRFRVFVVGMRFSLTLGFGIVIFSFFFVSDCI